MTDKLNQYSADVVPSGISSHAVCSYSAVRELTTCAYCKSMFNDPRVLPCGHTYCKSCIARIGSRTPSLSSNLSLNLGSSESADSLRNNGLFIKCLICRRKSVVGTVDEISQNLVIQKLIGLDRINLATNNACQICLVEPSLTTCAHCAQLGCAGCLQRHKEELLGTIDAKCKYLKGELVGTMKAVDKQLSEFDYAALVAKQQIVDSAQHNIDLVRQRAEELTANLELYLSHCKEDTERVVDNIRMKAAMIDETVSGVIRQIGSTGEETQPVSIETLLELERELEEPSQILPSLSSEIATHVPRIRFASFENIASDTNSIGLDVKCSECFVMGIFSNGAFLCQGTEVGMFSCPMAVTVDSAGKLYVIDQGNNRLQIISIDEGSTDSLTSESPDTRPKLFSGFCHPNDVFVLENPAVCIVTDLHRVVVLMDLGTQVQTLGKEKRAGSGRDEFDTPVGVCVGKDASIYVADSKNDRIVVLKFANPFAQSSKSNKLGWEREIRLPFGSMPQYICPVDYNLAYTSQQCDGRGGISVIDVQGRAILSVDTSFLVLSRPLAIKYVDQKIYVANSGGRSIAVFSDAGDFIQDIKYDHLKLPTGIALYGQRIFVADAAEHCVHQLLAPML